MGAPGAAVGARTLEAEPGPFTPFQLASQSTIYLGAVKTAEIPIPAGSTGDLVLERVESFVSCSLPAPPTGGLIIDDLRAE